MNYSAIYYRSASDARAAGELDLYRASQAELRRTRDVIDAAIAARFDGCTLPAAVLDDVLQQADPDHVALVLAATCKAFWWDCVEIWNMSGWNQAKESFALAFRGYRPGDPIPEFCCVEQGNA